MRTMEPRILSGMHALVAVAVVVAVTDAWRAGTRQSGDRPGRAEAGGGVESEVRTVSGRILVACEALRRGRQN